MAVEILRLARDGNAGRKKGAIINIKEAPDDQDIGWGANEGPPGFVIQRIEGVMKKDLPAAMLEFGGHKSKIHIDEAKLSTDEKTALADADRYGPAAKKAKATITAARLNEVVTDQGAEWADAVAEVL